MQSSLLTWIVGKKIQKIIILLSIHCNKLFYACQGQGKCLSLILITLSFPVNIHISFIKQHRKRQWLLQFIIYYVCLNTKAPRRFSQMVMMVLWKNIIFLLHWRIFNDACLYKFITILFTFESVKPSQCFKKYRKIKNSQL